MFVFRFALREIIYRRTYSLLFVISVAFGASVIVSLAGFGTALQKSIKDQARELWAADVTVRGSLPLIDHFKAWTDQKWSGRKTAQTISTISMARNLNGSLVSQVTLLAVSNNYPLYGRINTGSGRGFHKALRPGKVIVGKKLLKELSVSVGGSLLLGDLTVEITDVIQSRTDMPTSFFEFAPTIFLSMEDLEKTNLLVAGSRQFNKLYISFPEGVNIQEAVRQIKKEASTKTSEVSSWVEDNPGVVRFIHRTLFFLAFLGLFILTLGGVGVASTVSAVIRSSAKSIGVAFALGSPRSFIFKVWLIWVILLTSVGMVGAVFFGKGLAGILVWLFGDVLPSGVRIGFPLVSMGQAGIVCFGVSLLFVLLPLLKLMDVPPTVIFAEEIPVFPRRWVRVTGVLILSISVFYGVTLWQVKSYFVAMYCLLGMLVLLGFCSGLVCLVMKGLRSWFVRQRRFEGRLVGRSFSRLGNLNNAVIVAMVLSLSVILILFLLEKNITAGFIQSFPKGMPNVFFINVQKKQVKRFHELLNDYRVQLFPLIRGRVISVNGRLSKDINDRSVTRYGEGDRLTREFGFTFGDTLFSTDKLVKGDSLWNDKIKGPQVSIYDKYHSRFRIDLGDKIVVNVLGRRMEATVSSIRAIDQSVRQPFFYFHFKPGMIDNAPYTLMGGTFMPRDNIAMIEKTMAREFPNVTTIDLSEVADLTAKIMARLTRVINTMGLFGVISGLLLMVASLWTTLAARMKESVIYRTLGGTMAQVIRVFLLEYTVIGVAGAFMSWIVGSVTSWALLRFVFKLPFHFYLSSVSLFLLSVVMAVVGLSVLASRQVFRVSPMEVLRYESI